MFKIWDEGIDETLGSLFSGAYDLLLGRRTYDIFAAYWPYAEGENAAMGEAFDRANKYVLTRGDQPLEWQNSHRLGSVDDVAALKQTDGADLIIQGSSTIYPDLLAAGLIDVLITMTFPVTLGRGKRLLGDGTPVDRLTMIDHRVTDKGTLVATYRPGGTLPPCPRPKRPFRSPASVRSNVSGKFRRGAGDARPVWPPLLVLHLESADRALRQ